VVPAGRAAALICGDTHVAKSDMQVINATFNGDESICGRLKPHKIVYHDLLDFESRSHHDRNLLTERIQRIYGEKQDIVEHEIMEAISFIDEMTPEKSEPIVIIANHDEHFDRWLREANPSLDPVNARFFHEAWYKLLSYYEKHREFIPAFELFYHERGNKRARFIRRDDILKIAGIYCNFHGDKGLNGSRGSTLAYARLGVKTVVGHSHSPEIMDGCYKVGVSGKLDMDYNYTPTSWLNSHVVIYANGKRSLINIIDGKWAK
jgi:hypothetical protein